MKIINALLLASLITLPIQVLAIETPEDGATDAHLKTVLFREGEVIRLAADYSQETMIVLHPDESIDYLGAGEKDAWVFGIEGNLLTLKPARQSTPTTNMNLVTYNKKTDSTRYYAFLLDVVEGKEAVTWQLRFRYPADEKIDELKRRKRNREAAEVNVSNPGRISAQDWKENYYYSGDEELVPDSVRDNGLFTYFRFPQNGIRLPAIFAVNRDGTENIVNHHMEGDYLVVKRLAEGFVLKLGSLLTQIHRVEED